MADDTQGVQTPENETQEPATPTGEQQTTGAEPGNELPSEASERTKERFETLTKELTEERRNREALEKAFNTLKPKEQAKPDGVQPIYDPETGLLNEQALTNVQLRAQEAEKQAQATKEQLDKIVEDQKKQAQVREDEEAYKAHPELNPKDKAFSKDLRDVTASLMLQSMVHPEDFGNKQLTHKEAGDKAKELIAKISGNVKEQAAQEAIEQLSPKEQAALEATGSTQRRNISDLTDLQRQTRKGSDDALVERLRRVSQS